jgi:hypothetical protein
VYEAKSMSRLSIILKKTAGIGPSGAGAGMNPGIPGVCTRRQAIAGRHFQAKDQTGRAVADIPEFATFRSRVNII